MANTEKVFTIAVPEAELELLQKKLDLTRFPDELQDAGRDYGAPLADIQRLVAHWKNGYDWRKHEAALNVELPQFTRDIDVDGHGTLNIHYVHKKSEATDAIPLLFIHGWPGSFFEVRKVLPYLVEASSDHPSFHVVAISLPGYGFSEAPKKKGFEAHQMAEVGHKVMLALGYREYVVQGGDWGSIIGRVLAINYGPKHCKAFHTNMPMVHPPHPTKRPFLLLSHLLWGYNAEDRARLEKAAVFPKTGMGYFQQQSTQPQTLGYSLADSPAGLLGWIYEKLCWWTDKYPWTDDEVLTWISIYWFSRAGPTASTRIYYEFAKPRPDGPFLENIFTKIPTGFSFFPGELVTFPRRWYTWSSNNLVFKAEHQRGGHFAAYEAPDLLAGDLREMFGKNGPCFSVVPGRTGFARL